MVDRLEDSHHKLLQGPPGAQMATVVCRTGFISVEHSAGFFFVPVDLPQAGAFAPAGVVGDEARHILRRVAEKQPHLVGEFLLPPQPLHQLGHA